METFDYVIVGAGSAGCVLANRLSADPACRVALIEAGPRDWNPLIKVPIMAGRFYRRPYLNWSYETEPQPALKGRQIPWPRGRVLGGSSAINGMIYARGHAADYDGWAQMGMRTWSYDRVLPYFKRSERYQGGETPFHGADGPMPVTRPPGRNPLFQAFIDSGVEAGYPMTTDFNGPRQEGVGRYDYNILRGQRWSSARAFLNPVRGRKNLRIITGGRVLRVAMRGTVATGIELLVRGRPVVIGAEREVLLSGGTIGSAVTLLHSGIGDAAALAGLGIKVALDLPGVGRNLQDHMQAIVAHASDQPDEVYKFRRVDQAILGVLQSFAFGTGPATTFPTLAGAFLRSQPHLEIPDIQLHFILGSGAPFLRHPLQRKSGGYQGYGFNGSVCQLRPESRGEITLRSADPLAPPSIQPNYLSSATDRRVMREGIRMVRDIFRQKAFDRFRGRELTPGPAISTDAEIDDWIAGNSGTIFHPVGSCRMGLDDTAVVDEQLRVRGAERLRVIDASIMPTIPGANTHAATVMIAERGADLVRGQFAEAAE